MKVTVTLDIDFRMFKEQKEQLLTILQDGKYNIYAVECYSNLDNTIQEHLDSFQYEEMLKLEVEHRARLTAVKELL